MKSVFYLMAVVSAAASAVPALAKPIEEVRVTAEFRESTLMEAPLSMTVISKESIAARSAEHLEHVLNRAPNVNFSSSASRPRYFQIRGIGERGQLQEPINPSVGLIIDDVDFTGIGAAATMFDIEQVEVLRGPQGTRYGANAFAGLIFVNSVAPSEELGGNIELTAAEYGTYNLGMAVGGALTDSLLGRMAIQQHTSDGFTDNLFLQRDDTSERDELTVRTRLRWLPADDMTVDLMVLYVDVNNGYDAFSLDNIRDTITDEPGRDEQDSFALSTKIRWETNDSFNTEVILATNETDSINSFDEDWAFDGFDPFGYTSTDTYERERSRLSAELRLVSSKPMHMLGYSTDWAGGVFILDTKEELMRDNAFIPAGNFQSRYDTTTFAAFAQLESQISTQATVTFGLRIEQRDTDYAGASVGFEDVTQFDDSTDETTVGGKLVFDYQLNEDMFAFAGISRGFKAGGLNSDPNLINEGRGEYDTEFVWSYELGLKATQLGGRLQSQVSLFFLDRQDQQVDDFTCIDPNTGDVIENSANCTSNFIDFLGNAADGSSYGLELESRWWMDDNLQLFASLGLLQTEINNYVNANGDLLDGRNQAHAPEYQFSLGAQYQLNNFYGRVEVEGRDAFFFSEGHNGMSNSYQLWHARLGYSSKRWDIALWARNLGDEDYFVRGFRFGNDPRTFYQPTVYTQLGEPRVVGITGKYSF